MRPLLVHTGHWAAGEERELERALLIHVLDVHHAVHGRREDAVGRQVVHFLVHRLVKDILPFVRDANRERESIISLQNLFFL